MVDRQIGRKFARALLASSALIMPMVPSNAVAAAAQSPSPATVNLNIPAQDLSSALSEFARQSNQQLLYSPELVKGKKSSAVTGDRTPADGLRQLLNGSGVTFSTASSGAFLLGSGSPQGNGRTDADNSASLGQEAAFIVSGEPDEAVPEILVVGQKTFNTDIRRTEDGVRPYVVLTQKDLQQTGANNIQDALRTRLPMNAGRLTSNDVAQTTFQGTIDLRGLGAAQTLILVDGRRLASIPGSRQLSQTNVNGIPLAAVDRIEILPSTAGGIYGGNATGGVINVILKRDYKGLEISGEYAFAESADAPRYDINATGGTNIGGVSLTFSARHSKTTVFKNADRDFVRMSRQKQINNNPSLILGTNIPIEGYTTNICSGTNFFNLNVLFTCNATPLVLDNGTPLGSSITSVPIGYGGPITDAGARLARGAGNYNLDPLSIDATSKTDALGFSARGKLTSWLEGYLDLRWDRTKLESDRPSSLQGYLPASSPSNPFQQNILMTVPLPDVSILGKNKNENVNATVGAIVRISDAWTASADYTHSTSTVSGRSTAPLLTSARVTNGGPAALQGLQDTHEFPVLFPAGAILEPFNADLGKFKTNLDDVVGRLSGSLMSLSAGKVTFSGLLEARHEEIGRTFTQDVNLTTGLPQNPKLLPSKEQSVKSYYTEVLVPVVAPENQIPIANRLEASFSLRGDWYRTTSTADAPIVPSRNGPFPNLAYATNKFSKTTYTAGFKYVPIAGIEFRYSQATGFLPPSLAQINFLEQPLPASSLPYNDPLRGNTRLVGDPNNNGNISFVSGGNVDLQPEQSFSRSMGVILEPNFLPGLRISVDRTIIHKSNEILFSIPIPTLLADESAYPGRIGRGPNLPGDQPGWAGPVIRIDASAINVMKTNVHATDYRFDYSRNIAGLGKFHAFAIATHTSKFVRQLRSDSQPYNSAGFYDGPVKWRGNGGVDFQHGDLSAGLAMQYVGKYSILNADPNASFQNPARELSQGSDTVASQIYVDLNMGLRLDHLLPSILNGASINLGIYNVFDKQPPIIASTIEPAGYSAFGDAIGRRYVFGLRKEF